MKLSGNFFFTDDVGTSKVIQREIFQEKGGRIGFGDGIKKFK